MKRITKKDLIQIITENIYEMAMDYDTVHRPHADIEKKLKSNDTPISKIPLPKSGDEPNTNFQEFLASERYKEVVQNVKHYLGGKMRINLKGDEKFFELMGLMKNASNEIMRLEMAHHQELEQLAIKIVIDEFKIPDNLVQWDVKMTPLQEMNLDDFQKAKGEEINIEAVDVEKELFTDLQKLDLERAKRRLINAITQGASEKGHYSYHSVTDDIKKITGSDSLIDLYGIMMSVNDVMYWQYDDSEIDSKINRPGFTPAGTESVEDSEEEGGLPKIVVRGINFPVLVHECFKGFLDFMAINGIPKNSVGEYDEELWNKVKEKEDIVNYESWDIRLGPEIWKRIRSMFPDDITHEEGLREIQLYFLKTVYELPAKEFLVFMKEVIGQTENGKRLMIKYIDGIRKMFADQEYEAAISVFRDDLDDVTSKTSDDSMRDLLKGLGIDLSDDSEDDEDDDDGGVLLPRK
jgi:hypothetical protein